MVNLQYDMIYIYILQSIYVGTTHEENKFWNEN